MRFLIRFLLTLCLAWTALGSLQAQVRPEPYSNWFFGDKAGFTFEKDEFKVYTKTSVTKKGQLQTLEGCASISDVAGNLRFYTNGVTVWNWNHERMVNGFGLKGDTSSTQSVMIIPQPKNQDLYYIFTLTQGVTGNDLYYSVVDMSRQKGFGEVITRNVLLANNMSERLTTTLKNNGDDYWVLTHEANSDRFFSFSFDRNGVNKTPVISVVGSRHVGTCGSIGYMKSRCNRLAIAITNCAAATDKDRVEVFDFDNITGRITQLVKTYYIPNAYGIEFSTTSRYLYVSGWHGGKLWRIDLRAPRGAEAKFLIGVTNAYGTLSEVNSFGALMMGPDRNIYVAKNKSGFLGVINESGFYNPSAVSLEGRKSSFGLPNVPQFICECDIDPTEIIAADTICLNYSLKVEARRLLPPRVKVTDSVRWHFGDDQVDSVANTSFDNPAYHQYSKIGYYEVKLYQKCINTNQFLLMGIHQLWVIDCSGIASNNVCIGDTTQFRFLNGNNLKITSIEWNFGDPSSGANNTASGILNPRHYYASPGIYFVTAKVVYEDGYTKTYATRVRVYPRPVVDLGPDINMCAGDSLPDIYAECRLDSTITSYLWHDGSTKCYYLPKGNEDFISLTVSRLGCPSTDTVWVLRDSLYLGPNRRICAGDSVILGPESRWEEYKWSTGDDTTTIGTDSILVVKTAGKYVLTASRKGCTVSDTVEVFITTPPDPRFPADTVVCPPEQSLFLNVIQSDTSVTYLWSNGTNTPYQLITESGIYWVEITKGDCKRRDSINVRIVKPIELPDTMYACSADSSTTLSAEVGAPDATYLWSTGETTSFIIAKTRGWYKVTVTVDSCVQTDSTFLDYGIRPEVNLGNDTTVCQGPLILNAFQKDKNYTYSWNNNVSGPINVINETGLYIVTVSNDTCSVEDSIYVTIPELELGDDLTVCAGEEVYLRPQKLMAGATYTWNTLQTGDSIQVFSSGKYYVTMNFESCVLSDTINVTLVPKPDPDLGQDTIVCDPTQPLVLRTGVSGAGVTYLWSNGSTDSTLTADSSGTYWVEVRNGDCVGTDTISVNYLEIKFPKDTTICAGERIVLDAQQPLFATYVWHNGSTAPIFLADTAGIYWVEITMGTCSRRDSVEVKFANGIALNLGADTTICGTQPLVLRSGNPNTVWSTGETGDSITVNTTGIYVATLDNGGCATQSAIRVTYLNDNSFDLGPSQTICDQNFYVIDASAGLDPGIDNSIVKYLWGDGDTTYFKYVNQPGWYKVKVSFAASCTYEITDSVYVDFGITPTVDLGNDRFLCSGETVTLDATSSLSNVTYLWQDGSTSPTYNVVASGVYWVTVTNNGCSVTDTVEIIYANDFTLGPDQVVCNGQSVLLNAFTQGATSYLWQDGNTSPAILVNQSGLYWVEVSNGRCTARDSIQIDFVPQPAVDLGQDTVVCNAGEYTIRFTAEPGVNYLWNDGSTADSLVAKKSGWYWVDASRNTCVNRDSVFVFLPSVYLSLGADTTICDGTSLVLGNAPVDGVSYQWSTGETSSMITVTRAGDYFLEANIGGCIFTDRIKLTVRVCDSVTDNLFIPNIITPNNDGKNDQFVIEGIANKGWSMTIYNRWGTQIYQTDNYQNKWGGDGFPAGLYYYHLKHPTDSDKRYKGWLKILR
ncbi:hypothetical protein BKI52_36095 [marine bacterium AO1-C]|nr:hypothetical protein BKI52_36095 [marine bacterium AO1-C]